MLCDVVDTVVVGIKRAVLWRYGSGVRGGGVHAQRDAAGVGAERKPFSLNEPQFVTFDHDSALVDNDEAGVIGPGVVRNCDLLVREHAGHVAPESRKTQGFWGFRADHALCLLAFLFEKSIGDF